MIVFVTHVEITHQDSHLGTRHDQDTKHQEQEANAIIDSVEPDRVHDKIKLNKDSTKGQDATHQDGGSRLQVKGLIGNLTRDLVGTNGWLDTWFTESNVRTKDAQGKRNDEPECDHGQHRAKRNGSRRIRVNQKEVET